MNTNVNTRDVVIWSGDVKTTILMLETLEHMGGGLSKVKADRLFVERNGFRAIDRVIEAGYQVFDDAKLVEIPSKLEELAKLHVVHKPWMLNCMAGSLSNGELNGDEVEALLRFAGVCAEAGVLSCGVTVLTTKTPEMVEAEFGRDPIDQVLFYVEWLVQCGFTDVVCSPLETEAIKAHFDITTNTPGIRLPDSPPDDQARTRTPLEAVRGGADRLVIGRPLTAGHPAHNLKRIEANLLGQAS